jgi:hypothetical protein
MAGTYTTTAKYLLRKLTGGSLASDIDEGFASLGDDIDARMAGYSQGTLASRPGAAVAGKLYRATDTGELFIDTGSVWQPAGWTTASLLNSWVSNGAPWADPSYRRELDGKIRIRGMANGGTVNSPVFNLPSGFRPPNTVEFTRHSQAGNLVRLQVTTAGDVVQVGTTQGTISLDGVMFAVS